MASIRSPTSDKDNAPRTLVHDILESSLPSAEKDLERIYRELSTVTSAGFEATASTIRLILYHVFSNANILRRLRDELASATAETESPKTLSLKTLEQLPYLTAVIREGLRLNPGVATRMARIAPDREIVYGKWSIPAGTPVGMTTMLMHTNETLYPNPMSFEPDRWMDNGSRKKLDKTFAPFSKGTRICLGMQ